MKELYAKYRKFLAKLLEPDPSFRRYSIDGLYCPSAGDALFVLNGEVTDLIELLATSKQLTIPENHETKLAIVGSCLVVQSVEQEMES